MNAKRTITFIIITTLALLVAACGADKGADTTPEPPAPVAPAEAPQPPEGRPNPGEQGQGPGFGSGGALGFMTIISEATGLSTEALQEELAGGVTMAEIIAANGDDVEAVRAQLIEAMSEMPNAQEGDIEQRVSDLLNTIQPGGNSKREKSNNLVKINDGRPMPRLAGGPNGDWYWLRP